MVRMEVRKRILHLHPSSIASDANCKVQSVLSLCLFAVCCWVDMLLHRSRYHLHPPTIDMFPWFSCFPWQLGYLCCCSPQKLQPLSSMTNVTLLISILFSLIVEIIYNYQNLWCKQKESNDLKVKAGRLIFISLHQFKF